MTHDDARVMVSALADDELETAGIATLSSHLESCGACTRYSEQVRSLSLLARALPAEEAPASLADRVRVRTVEPRIAPRRHSRTVLALAAVFAVALIMILGGLPLPTFDLPTAEAARALQSIRTFTMERDVTDLRPDVPVVTNERMWYRAPGFLRIERRSGGTLQIEIRRPGERYTRSGGRELRETGLAPDPNPVPEPLSPTVGLLGRRAGPGPEVAGHPTIRVELSFARGERRIALVDAARFVVLGAERHSIVGKETRIDGRLVETKRTISVQYNAPVDNGLFAIPPIEPLDRGFSAGTLSTLAAPPRAVPKGMSLVTAGAGRVGSAALFADGAFGVLVTVDAIVDDPDERATTRRPVRVAGRPATMVLSLFDLPRVVFEVGGHTVTVAAPLAPEDLVALAASLYPAE